MLAGGVAVAQPMSRRAVTIPALKAFPAFYNGQSVLLRAELRLEGQRGSLAAGEDTIPAFIRSDVSGSGVLEVRGEVWDIGRMQPDDQRLSGKDLRSLLGVDPSQSWPRPGELVVVNVTSAAAADPLTAPSLRNIVLAPERYVDQRVTIQGQFRGRNLFGDQPQAPPGRRRTQGVRAPLGRRGAVDHRQGPQGPRLHLRHRLAARHAAVAGSERRREGRPRPGVDRRRGTGRDLAAGREGARTDRQFGARRCRRKCCSARRPTTKRTCRWTRRSACSSPATSTPTP